ncbi:MAG: hypothetical protein J5I65_18385 [Aridibacter famidurans]|nr:hypothetical protein [Aridibacter famidurans]
MRIHTLLMLAAICGPVTPAACSAQSAGSTSEKSAVAARTQENPRLWLNGEPMGSAGDTSQLRSKLSEIVKLREQEGSFTEGSGNDLSTMAIPLLRDGVYLAVDPDLSIGDFEELYQLVDEIATVQVPLNDPKGPPTEPEPNLLLLVLTAGKDRRDTASFGHFTDLDTKREFSLYMHIKKTADAGQIWYNRIVGSIEIRADGSYILNERDVRKDGFAFYPPTQRPLRSSLKDEVLGVAEKGEEGGRTLTIVAHPSAPYSSLEEIFKLARELNILYQITVTADQGTAQ